MLSLPRNNDGRDFFVGDLHGCYELLQHRLVEVQFNPYTDRLISVGDLADRGPSSEQCVHLIEKHWFFAVRGNHEDMCIGVHRGGWPTRNFDSNGGGWFLDLYDFPERQEEVVTLMESLPTFIEVPIGDKMIGVLHADCNVQSWKKFHTDNYNKEAVLWGRMRVSKQDTSWVNDIDAVIVGHTPLEEVMTFGNVIYIDTGAVYGGGLTLIEGKDLLDMIPTPPVDNND